LHAPGDGPQRISLRKITDRTVKKSAMPLGYNFIVLFQVIAAFKSILNG
jgi:hypothetical protein